jgi:hypothetical protein
MLTQRLRFIGACKPLLIGGVIAASLTALVIVSDAQNLPVFRKGIWEFTRTVDKGSGKPQTIRTRKCTNPTDDMKKQNEMLTKAGCKFSPVTRSGTSYSFTAQCNIQGGSAQSKSVISVDSDDAYKVTVESHQGGQSAKEILVAKRTGDCP